MKRIVVNGGKELAGDIIVSGSKNASLPIIFACILMDGVSEIENLPDIGDVRVALDILRSLGAVIERRIGVTYIDTRHLTYVAPDPNLVEKIRASTYLIGSCLSRFGRCPIMSFGGCNFSLRPIDMHLYAAEAMGACLDNNVLISYGLRGGIIDLKLPSVGATVNSILLAASAEGASVIRGCAIEPHIDSLIDFLNSAGGDIHRRDREIWINGRALHGGKIRVIGDMIESGSYLALSLMTGCGLRVLNSPVSDMQSVFDSFIMLGADINVSDDAVSVTLDDGIYTTVVASHYPGFPTDLQPIFAPLLAYYRGGKIIDNVWQSRFGYLHSLEKFSVKYKVDSNSAEIYDSNIKNGCSFATDLRGGFAALMCALSSDGISEIASADRILRGYERLEEKLKMLGAEIKINNEN